MRHAQHFSRMQIRLDELLIRLRLGLIGSQDLNPVRPFGGLVGRYHDHAIRARLYCALARRVQPDNDFESAIAEILRLCMSLAAVADNCDCFALQPLGLGIALIKNSDHQ